MKRGKFARGLGAWLALIVLSCGESSDDGGGDIPISSMPAELARVYCSIIEQCFGTYLELLPISDCQQQYEQQFENGAFPAINEALAAGVVRYDAHQARVCVDAMLAQGCDLFTHRSPASCDAALAGDVPLGSACSINAECAGDAFCDLAGGTCPGVCAVRREADADCVSDEGCTDGLTCQSSKCVAPAQAGHACGGPSGPECRTGLVCVGETDTASGTCGDTSTVTSGKLGDSCSGDAQQLCDPSLSCVIDTPLTAPPTFSCKAKSGSGATCARGFPEPCPNGEYCNVPVGRVDGGVCEKLPGAGEPCVTGVGRLTTCAAELVCSEQTCRERNVNGAACAAPIECYSQTCTEGVCVGDEFCTP